MTPTTRRTFIKLGLATAVITPIASAAETTTAHTLAALPYSVDALEPSIDKETMTIHHGKHHQAYITNANNFLKDQPALEALDVNALIADLSKVPEAIRGGLRNNAGGDNTVVFDDLTIATRNSGWSYAAWTDEATAVVDSFKPFTHAYNFGSAAGATIRRPAAPGVRPATTRPRAPACPR